MSWATPSRRFVRGHEAAGQGPRVRSFPISTTARRRRRRWPTACWPRRRCFCSISERKLRYVGRIDDSDVKTVTSHDTRNAIDALLAGKPVPVEKTRDVRLLDQVVRQAGGRRASRWRSGTRSRSSCRRSTKPAWRKLVKNDTDKLLVVNVWATWCGPCVAELPEFVTMHRMYRKRNFQMVTISMDEPEQKDAALKVLQETARRGDELPLDDRQPRQARRPARQGVAGPGALHAADRPRRQGALSQDGPDRAAGGAAGDRGFRWGGRTRIRWRSSFDFSLAAILPLDSSVPATKTLLYPAHPANPLADSHSVRTSQ